jgi:choline dehydrogenase-like flavoprotein
VPLAVASRPYQGRPACVGCGFCSRSGCRYGSKGSAAEAVLPRALATGRCALFPDTRAIEITLDEHARARGVVHADARGRRSEQRARVVVVACGAVESARLLLLSRSSRFPRGLGNGNDLVGRYLTFHVIAEVGGFFAEPVHLHRGVPTVRALDDYYFPPQAAGGPLGGVLLLGDGLGPIGFAERHTRWGDAQRTDMARYPHHLRMFVIGQDLPMRDNRVDLDPDRRDPLGLPVARITHRNHPFDLAATNWIAERGRALLTAAGARETYVEPAKDTTGDAHQHGTCRFGADPETSVLDRDCAVHEVPNLYVTDGSFMPNPGGVNPALSIQANALRVGRRIAERLRA